ncbi:MAG: type II toxin-antitoxin system VapC family toxin [Desulfovermiculus sp.]|nr:type II toxin-antitoxin system VapC family toxin [Desulfovermiculus sp.]
MSGDNKYFDTSALLPYYREEPASKDVQVLLGRLRPPVLLSDLTRVAMASAIARWTRMNEIDEPQAALIENTFFEMVWGSDPDQRTYLLEMYCN